MNERIRELAKQAEQAADAATYAYDDDTGKWQKMWNEVYDEKFTELIVRECMKEMGISKQCDPYTGEVYVSDYNRAIDDQISMLVEHFGIDSESEIEYCPKCNVEWSGTSCGIPDCGWITGVEE